MADPRFFRSIGPLAVADLASRLGLSLPGNADPGVMVAGAAPLDAAGPQELSFIDNRKYVDAFARTQAGVVIAAPGVVERAPPTAIVLVSKDPYRDYARAAAFLHPDARPDPGVDARSVIGEDVQIGDAAHVGANVVIGAGARIGARVVLHPNVVIGPAVEIGDDTEIGANASLSHCLVGARVLIHPGVRIGTRGFGFALGEQGFVKVPQLGRVIIGDDVEIGANSTIDRGAGPDTVIGAGTMIDNLVQIGHNVRVGRGCVIVAQSGIAGSTELGDFVMLGAQGGIAGHLKIGSRARVAAQSGVMRDVAPGETVGGSPAVPQREWLRQSAWLHKNANRRGD